MIPPAWADRLLTNKPVAPSNDRVARTEFLLVNGDPERRKSLADMRVSLLTGRQGNRCWSCWQCGPLTLPDVCRCFAEPQPDHQCGCRMLRQFSARGPSAPRKRQFASINAYWPGTESKRCTSRAVTPSNRIRSADFRDWKNFIEDRSASRFSNFFYFGIG
ncbi:hypothetical protein D3C85_1385940 [compost metagenome]